MFTIMSNWNFEICVRPVIKGADKSLKECAKLPIDKAKAAGRGEAISPYIQVSGLQSHLNELTISFQIFH